MKTLIVLGEGRVWIIQYSGENPHCEAEMQIYGRAKGIRTEIIVPWHDLCLH
jgi:hypothetical protein